MNATTTPNSCGFEFNCRNWNRIQPLDGGGQQQPSGSSRNQECLMRKTLLPLAAAIVVSAAALLPTQASAMTTGTAPGIAAAIEASSLVENARRVCRHNWRTSRRHCYWRPTTVCRHSWRTSRRICYRR